MGISHRLSLEALALAPLLRLLRSFGAENGSTGC